MQHLLSSGKKIRNQTKSVREVYSEFSSPAEERFLALPPPIRVMREYLAVSTFIADFR